MSGRRSDSPGVHALGADCAGVVDVAAYRAAGLKDSEVRWLVDSGRWQSPFPRVFVTFNGPLPLATRFHAALAYTGLGAALSHASAGALWRICPEPSLLHLTVPYCRRVRPQPGLVLHRSRRFSDADVHPALSPRRTRVERTVIDLIAECGTGEAALGLVADALRNRSTTPDRLRAALLSSVRPRWKNVLLVALPDLRAGAQSVLELRDAEMRRQHGLPMGTRQARRLHDGSEYLDVLIEEWGVHVELDGRLGHDRDREIWRDMKRDHRSEVQGLRHLRYGWADMVDRPCAVAAEQAGVLRQQGWTGELRRCPSCAS